MATLRRCHAPVPWGAQVEKMTWKRSQSGTPKRRRSDRPSLTHDPGWDWDGTQILFTEQTVVLDEKERDCEVCEFQRLEDEHSPLLSGQTHATLSLFDIARYQVTKRHGKGRAGLDDFEVIRIPKVVPISEEEHDLEDGWKLGWEKLDAFSFKRTYSEVARGFIDGEDPPNIPGCSEFIPSGTEDDPWEYL